MIDEKNPFRTHKKALVDTAFETLLTSHWISDLDLSEQAYRKIFSDPLGKKYPWTKLTGKARFISRLKSDRASLVVSD